MGAKEAKGHFSAINGSKVRIMYTPDGIMLGTITKLDGKQGYRIHRMDGKIRIKSSLADAYKSVRRVN